MNKTKNCDKKDMLVKEFDLGRSLLTNKDVQEISKEELHKNILGFILFFLIFVLLIPHLFLKKKWYLLSTLYFSNLDLTSTVLGFSGGPYDMWKYLYNPAVTTMFGFFSTTVINYLSLIGVGFVCIRYATVHKRVFGGLALLLIILPITYLIPANYIVYWMNYFSNYLYTKNVSYYTRWFITVLLGLSSVTGIISIERAVAKHVEPTLEKTMNKIYKYYN